jgi:hypothetical protein
VQSQDLTVSLFFGQVFEGGVQKHLKSCVNTFGEPVDCLLPPGAEYIQCVDGDCEALEPCADVSNRKLTVGNWSFNKNKMTVKIIKSGVESIPSKRLSTTTFPKTPVWDLCL